MARKPSSPSTALPAVVRTTAGLRDALFDELDRLRNGDTDATSANAVARLADQISNTVIMELEVQKFLARQPDGPEITAKLPQPLALGGA